MMVHSIYRGFAGPRFQIKTISFPEYRVLGCLVPVLKCLFLAVPLVGVYSVIVAFSGQARTLFKLRGDHQCRHQ